MVQAMNDDEEICLCFHVTRRKVTQFIRVNKPVVASQLSECYGAGTGCGWCRPFLKHLMEEANPDSAKLPDRASYAADRQEYRNKQP
jgi:NAD(P)H-nitrite reductase large subunit